MEEINKKVKGENRVSVITFSATPIPQPVEKVNRNKNWVDWGGDNQYPKYLIDLSIKSSLHSSILKQKSMLIGGGGWSKTNLSPEAQLLLLNTFNEDDLDELLYKIAMDLEVYGGFFLNLIWNKGRNKITEINYIDPAKVRIQPINPEDKYPQIENYWVSDGWEKTEKYTPVLYPGFSTIIKKKRSQILYVKEYRPGTEYYAIPEYISGCRWIEMEFDISNWHLNNIRNGMVPNMHINFPIGEPSNEEGEFIIKRLKGQYQGSENAGNTVVTFSDDKDSAVTFDPIDSNTSDSKFLMLNDQVTEGILKAHRVVNPSLFGIQTPGSLGSKNEMLESLEIFQSQYTEPKQRTIEKIFNWICRINGIKDRLLINKYTPQFSKLNVDIKDVLLILQAEGITAQQKYDILLANDYDHQTAAKFTGYHEGNNLKHIDKANKSKQNKPKEDGTI